MFTLRFFKDAAEDCGFSVGEPRTRGEVTEVDLHQKTTEGKDWWLTLTFTNPEEIADILAEMIDTYDLHDNESWYNEETGEYETFDALVDDERWKVEVLTDLLNELVV